MTLTDITTIKENQIDASTPPYVEKFWTLLCNDIIARPQILSALHAISLRVEAYLDIPFPCAIVDITSPGKIDEDFKILVSCAAEKVGLKYLPANARWGEDNSFANVVPTKEVLVSKLGRHGVLVDKYIESELTCERAFVEEVLCATESELGYEMFSECKTENEAWRNFNDAVDTILDDADVYDEEVRDEFHLNCTLRFWNKYSDAWGKVQFCNIADELKEEYPDIRVESAKRSEMNVWAVDIEGLQEGEETDAMFMFVEILKRKGGFDGFSYDTNKIGKFWIVCRES